jgi:hypothetical protein
MGSKAAGMLFGQFAFLVSALFTGAAFYVNFAEQPARLSLGDRALLAEWKIAYQRGTAVQAPLALIGCVLGLLAWYRTGHLLFLLGGLVMIANWPWTLLVMMPINNKLMATPLEAVGADTRPQIQKWNGFHAMRTVFGFLAVVAFFFALIG